MITLIKNGMVWTSEGRKFADILIEDEKILAVERGIEAPCSAHVIDATSKWVIPGGIDVHTHFELPLGEFSSVDDFSTGTKAALFGGTTTIIDFATQEKGESPRLVYKKWREKADLKVFSDYGLHLALSDLSPQFMSELDDVINEGVTSFKIYMAYPNMMINKEEITKLLKFLKERNCLLMAHAEDGVLLEKRMSELASEGKLSPAYHALSHSKEIEVAAVKVLCAISKECDYPIYIVHTTCAEALQVIEDSKAKIIVETCPHYLLLNDEVYKKPFFESAPFVISPPLRTEADSYALWKAIAENKISVVATDHCSFNLKDGKDRGEKDFRKIPNGAAGVEHRFQLLFTYGVMQGWITMEQLIAIFATTPAKIFGLQSKGSIEAKKDADLFIFDPMYKGHIHAKTHHHAIDHSIYENLMVQGRLETLFLRGGITIENGTFLDSSRRGGYLERSRFSLSNGG